MNRNNIAAERTGGKIYKRYLTLIKCSMYIHTCIESQLTYVTGFLLENITMGDKPDHRESLRWAKYFQRGQIPPKKETLVNNFTEVREEVRIYRHCSEDYPLLPRAKEATL